jgi:phosphoglycerol transferase MdoB-like AlkP superfamily enzyme
MQANKIKEYLLNFFKTLIEFLKANTLVAVITAILLVKLLTFSAQNNLWAGADQLHTFLLYNFCAAAILTIPALFIKKYKNQYLIIIDLFITLILVIDTVYIRFFDTLPVITLINSTSELSGSASKWVGQLLSSQDLYLILDFIIFIFLYCIKATRRLIQYKSDRRYFRLAAFFALIPILILTTLIVQGSHEELPYLYTQISENKVVAKDIGVLGAHIVDVTRNLAGVFDKVTPAEENTAFATIKANTTTALTPNSLTGIAKGKRIIMIQVESLDNFTIGEKVNGQEVTPNLNKLRDSSDYFADDYFTLGAGGTSDADFSVNTSIFPLIDASAFVEYGKDSFTSLEKELKAVGYTTNAYHANSRGYWNRDTAFKSLGFDNFFAEDNYKKGETINMGLSDKDFLEQSFTKLQAQPTQSLNYLITLSSHFSIEIPDKDKGLNLPAGKYPELTTNYLQAIHYTDGAIGEFIQELKDAGMYNDSLIVLYGDHTARYDAFTDDSGNRIDLNTTAGKRIPLFIKLPDQTVGAKYQTPSSHLDIMPTILNLVGAKPTSPMFGKDLFGKTSTFFFTSTFENNFEQIVSGSLKYLNNNTDLTCYKYTKGQAAVVDISACDPLLTKRNQIQDAVDLLIKHNLFKDYLASK